MSTGRAVAARHPAGEQPSVECGKERSVIADTFAGRVHVEWEEGEGASMTPLGQLPFFIEYLKQGGLFDAWVAGCPLSLTSPNAPRRPGQSTTAREGQGGQRGRGSSGPDQD